jgi:hypothetical protein
MCVCVCVCDTEHEIENRIEASKCNAEKSSIEPTIVAGLKTMLDDNNVLAKTFRMARDRFKEDDYHDYTLKLIGKWNKSGTYNLPSTSEVDALIVRDPNEQTATRDILIDLKDMRLQRVSNIHPRLMSLQYPLLFPYGEDGFTLDIPYRCGEEKKRKNITMLEYISYYLF